MANITVKVNDYHREIAARLEEAGSRALDDARDIAIEAIKANVPAHTGRLRESIRELSREGTTVHVGTDVGYAHFIEYGTRRHHIYPRIRKSLFWLGAVHPEEDVDVQGVHEHPFMRMGLAQAQGPVRDVVRARMRAAVEL